MTRQAQSEGFVDGSLHADSRNREKPESPIRPDCSVKSSGRSRRSHISFLLRKWVSWRKTMLCSGACANQGCDTIIRLLSRNYEAKSAGCLRVQLGTKINCVWASSSLVGERNLVSTRIPTEIVSGCCASTPSRRATTRGPSSNSMTAEQ